MTIKRVTVAQHERALVWKNKTFAGVLEPGKHWLIAPMSDVEAQREIQISGAARSKSTGSDSRASV